MKTKLYFLEIENIENKMLSKMRLTEKEFKKQLLYLQKRVLDTIDEDVENKVTVYKRKLDFDSYTEIVYCFTNCCCDTILTQYICKSGWYFNK